MPATSEVYTVGERTAAAAAEQEKSAEETAPFSLFCDEAGYLNQIKYILQHGVNKGDRTGTGVLSVFGLQARYSLRGGSGAQLSLVLVRLYHGQLLTLSLGAENQRDLLSLKPQIFTFST